MAALYLESMSSAVHGETRVFVMAVTASPLRLYLFLGGPTLEVSMMMEEGGEGVTAVRRGAGGGGRSSMFPQSVGLQILVDHGHVFLLGFWTFAHYEGMEGCDWFSDSREASERDARVKRKS